MAMCALALMTGPGVAGAAGIEPVESGWKGKSEQGYPIYFGVSAGKVFNVRLSYSEFICGKTSVHKRASRLEIDEAGHFAGTVLPKSVELEGSFVAPNRIEGTIIVLENRFEPHCDARQEVPFTAHPRQQVE